MKPSRAFAIRLKPPSVERSETDSTDLSSFSSRPLLDLHPDAVGVAPPQEFWTPLAGPIPGKLITGTLPGDPVARYLLRIPAKWNGRLVVSGSPGITCEHGYDLYWSDFLLKEGYAFACTDKGVRTFMAGDLAFVPQGPENGIRHWYGRLKALTVLCEAEAFKAHGRNPERIYAVGVSNGGYLVKRAMEDPDGPFHGGVEVSGVLWREDRNFLIQIPEALRNPMGLPDAAWNAVLALYRTVYWEGSLQLFLGDLDPEYAGPLHEYRFASRPPSLREGIREFQNTGKLRKPLVSLTGSKDFLVTNEHHADAYRRLVEANGCSDLHRLVVVKDATHVDKDRELFPFVNPLMSSAHKAFLELTA